MRGYIQVYTGDGKGKTTAALGLALRASGAGLKVYFAQFVKGMVYSEIKALRNLSHSVVIKQYGKDGFINRASGEEDKKAAEEGLNDARRIVKSGEYDLVILDEANIAVQLDLISVKDLLELIYSKPDHVEIVLTGRSADPKIIEAADLVTEMTDVKHYYRKGIQARNGIER
ncbi:MAG: cob(I)yrinic acid a,c-diamide adenosyltransferase [Deltaproteobacteria bacterium]|nr:cob(I)yrinic acid a,c-diamide adenosyltransferase [Deltaproteobacteria bacterium]MBM4322394.1 cob(I)yrinic acid a,c-diamide adenosyltransferase [Deltaproteobacteria bacterium]MBM4346784.1 cob(I)yrinic acid a,c-diamide adenosyltransferase [Deltaproteobacteria bacterium]